MYAVVRTGGKQYRVQEGRSITIERLPGDAGDTVELGDVLLIDDGSNVTIGAPTVEGARVVGTIAEQGRAKKIIVFRYKNKTRARKKNGHRQQFTRLTVEDILAPGQKPKAKAAKASADAPVAAEAPDATEADAETPAAKPKRASRKKTAEKPTATAEATTEPATAAETPTKDAE